MYALFQWINIPSDRTGHVKFWCSSYFCWNLLPLSITVRYTSGWKNVRQPRETGAEWYDWERYVIWILTLFIVSFCSIHEDNNQDDSQTTEQTPSVWFTCWKNSVFTQSQQELPIFTNWQYNLIYPHKSFFFTIQTFFTGGKIIITGDGRFDSPGHSARYCHYIFVDYVSMCEKSTYL